ncbi:MAG: alpha/beta hydrolase [Actinobacteria bacterium]|nr:alpha/beta hydrolase [Actinomycetota bacterium]
MAETERDPDSSSPPRTWRLPRKFARLGSGVVLAYADLSPASEPADGQQSRPYAAAQPPTLVLVHGYTNDADSWADVVTRLRELLPDHRFLVPDLRGHGASGLPDGQGWHHDPILEFSIARQAGDIAALLEALGIGGATVVGHSMGALVAQQLAADHPALVSRLVLVSTTSDARGTPFLSDWLVGVIEDQWRPALETKGFDWPEEAMAATPADADPEAVSWLQQYWNYYPLTPERSTLEVARRASRLPLATWIGALQGILGTSALPAFDAPTLVLWGTQDSFFRRASQESLIAQLSRRRANPGMGAPGGNRPTAIWKQYGRLPLPDDGIQLDDLGHNLTWDAPVEVAADVVAFVTTGRPTSTWFRTDAPAEPHRIIGEPEAAVMVVQG